MKNLFKVFGFSGRDAAITKSGSLHSKLQGIKSAWNLNRACLQAKVPLLILILILILGFTMTACDDLGSLVAGKTALATPTGVDVVATSTSLTLVWDAVEGADSYRLDIGGVLHQVSGYTNSYDLKALTADPKVYNIRVRAVAHNGDPDHFDSADSAVKSVEIAEYVFEFEDDGNAPMANIRAASSGKAIKELKPYGKTLERVVVPSTFNGASVTAIAPNAFADGGNVMSSISLPNTIITIGAGAFAGTNIGDIVIPESVLNIGEGAFKNCIVLVVVVFVAVEPPAMEADVFEGSTNIETIVVPEGSESAFAEIAEEVNAEVQGVVENAKLLLAIEVIEHPKTTYTVGEFFSKNGMTVIARYSDNTTAPIQNYSVMLRAVGNAGSGNTGSGNTGTGNTGANGEFEVSSRALTLNDTAVRLSYTEGSVTKTTDIAIKVTQVAEYIININAANGGNIYTNQTGTVKAGTTVTFYVNVNQGYTMTNLRVMNNNTNQQINHQTAQGTGSTSGNAGSSAGNSYTFVMPASDVTIFATFQQNTTGNNYTVTFDANGGTFPSGVANVSNNGGTLTVQVQAGGVVPTSQVPNPTRQGYTFNGWYTTVKTADTQVPFTLGDTAVYENLTVYASWSSGGGTGDTYKIIWSVPTGDQSGYVTTYPQIGAAVAVGTSVTITVISPGQGYILDKIRVTYWYSGSEIDVEVKSDSAGGKDYFFMPAADVTVTAWFIADTTGGGTGQP